LDKYPLHSLYGWHYPSNCQSWCDWSSLCGWSPSLCLWFTS